MTAPLRERLLHQAGQCLLHGSPLTAALLEGAAADLAAGGPVAELLAPLEADDAGSVPALRLAGSLHRLVLERRAPALALHYPSVGGTAPVSGVWPAARTAVAEHRDALRELVRRPVQTNEVGRSAALFGALALLPGPFRLLEVGASAGLNLRCDRFAYDLGDGTVLGDAHSGVRLLRPWEGPFPAYDTGPHVLERRGCDTSPVDPATTGGRLTLTSYVWADQVDRLERLRAALDVAARVPAVVERSGALDFLARELAVLPPGRTTVVWHSIVRQYVAPAEREAVDALLARVGAAATPQAPLARVSLEPERFGEHDVTYRVHVQCWPGGRRVHVADAQGHGPPVRWTGARIDG